LKFHAQSPISGGLALQGWKQRLMFTVSLSLCKNMKNGRVLSLSLYNHRRSLPYPIFTNTTLHRQQEIRRQECHSEAKKAWTWRFGTMMMQEMNGIDGELAAQWANQYVVLAGIMN
jgi:hypothetical protein